MNAIGVWTRIAIAAGVIVLGWLLFGSRTTDHRHLKASPTRRTWRAVRTMYVSAMLNVLAWPHVIDVLLRTTHAKVGVTPSEVVWVSSTGATLRRYAGRRTRRTPILFVHSVITEPWILDLADDHSLIGHLVDDGHDVYLLDWGTPDRRSTTLGLSKSVAVLRAAERVVLRESSRRKLDLVGYCLGATICLIRAAMHPSPHVRSIAAIAPPVDMEAGGKLARFMRHRLLMPGLLLDGDSCVAPAYIRETFHALRPQAIRSVRLGWRLRKDPGAMAYYGAMARWAWEQRPLAGAMFLDLVALFRSNALHEGTLRIDDTPVDLSDIACRVLVLVAERDHIVPPDSSTPLRTGGPVEIVRIPSGHVSMIVGTGARQSTWPALTRWFSEPSTRAREKAKPKTRPKPRGSRTQRARR